MTVRTEATPTGKRMSDVSVVAERRLVVGRMTALQGLLVSILGLYCCYYDDDDNCLLLSEEEKRAVLSYRQDLTYRGGAAAR